MRKIILFLIEAISNIYVMKKPSSLVIVLLKLYILSYDIYDCKERENQNRDINDSSMMMHILRIYTHNFTRLKSLRAGYMGEAVTVEEREPVEITYERSK